ncbi:translation elongation factor Ts [Edaphocola flava]|jgi:elongation factor Ts|uniref:translation elongation factor Ts n=1 Tax=Edaphocola flava TaxID=2499629 RepID=UPI00100AB7DD|nr:translation elongation factor Ts [Edaphocola flava]
MSTVSISAADVNKLRQATGAGMMDCRKALTESGGDFEKAIDYLRLKGQKVAANRSDRDAKEGVAIAVANSEGTYGIVLQVSAETDFVSKNQEFIDFSNEIAAIALENKPADVDALKALSMGNATVADKLLEMVAKIGEKIDVVRYEQIAGECVVPYIHGNFRIGVLVGLNKAKSDALVAAGRDVAMQIAAMNPLGLDENSIAPEVIEREKALAIEQIVAEGKPADMAEKIAAGKMNKFFKENTLVNQPFVKDNGVTIAQYLNNVEAGLVVTSFYRVALG